MKEKTISAPVEEKMILFPYLNQVNLDKLGEIIMEKIFFYLPWPEVLLYFGCSFLF